jgi:hypothetical protein
MTPGMNLLQIARGESSFDLYFFSTGSPRGDRIVVGSQATYVDSAGNVAAMSSEFAFEPTPSGHLSKLGVPYSHFDVIDPNSLGAFSLSARDESGSTTFQFSKPGDLRPTPEISVPTNCWEMD